MDWKWMIERGGRVTFTVISAPTHTSTPPRPPPNKQTNPMTLKVSIVPGVFRADRIGPISLNLHYLALKEKHLAAINSTFFCFPVSLHSYSSRYTVRLTVWRYCAFSCSLNLMKKTLEKTTPDSTSQSVWETNKSDTEHFSDFKMGLMWKILMHAQFPLKYLQCFLSPVYKQMREFSQ